MQNHNEIQEYSKDQYSDPNNLENRINLWEYGTNPISMSLWIYSKFKFRENQRVLELGSGTGKLWHDNLPKILPTLEIILSDFSQMMVDKMKKSKIQGPSRKISFQQMDAQQIPFPDINFDHIIACHMLYHVPDLDKALSEIFRVLKPGGYFYASTIAEDHLQELYRILQLFQLDIIQKNKKFTDFHIISGLSRLQKVFPEVTVDYYENQVIVDKSRIDLFMKYIQSMFPVKYFPEYASYHGGIREKLLEIIRDDGEFPITGKSGILIAKK
ncbi:MAG: class I SAM-dependent methyltransferase [Promethearchaeota archaeon]